MSDSEGWCPSCDTVFHRASSTTECPECGNSSWVPYGGSGGSSTSPKNEFSGSKQVDSWEYETLERDPPQPNVQELRITTEDGWVYTFREPGPKDGYEIHEKTRPDGATSDDDVVPVEVAEYIDSMVVASLNYAKLIVHPSSHVYDPPPE